MRNNVFDSPHKGRLQELQEMFPETPKSIIVKVDVILNGLRPNKDMAEMAQTTIAFPYFSKKQGELGFAPSQFLFPDETTALVIPSDNSPYEFKIEDGKYMLYRDNLPVDEIHFTPRPKYIFDKTSDDSYIYTLFLQRGDSCIIVSPTNYCEYFKKNEDCKFCAFNPVWESAKGAGFKIANNPDIVAEGVATACEEVKLDHVKICGGSLYDTKKEANLYLKFTKAIKKATGIWKIDFISQAFDLNDSKRMKDEGVIEVCWDIEVWQKHLWPQIVPGKNNAVGWDEWVKRCCDAVGIFGEGHVGTNIVGGVETIPENGYKTIDDAIKSTLEGCEWLITHGILPTISIWFATPGSKYEKTNHAPTEYHLKVGMALHKLLIKHGMYTKTGHKILGRDPSYRRIFCHKCCFDNISQDYPRLMKDGG